MKLKLFKISVITVSIFAISFSLAYAGYEISVYRKNKEYQQKIEAFKQSGIQVAFEDRKVLIQPVNLDTLVKEVEIKLGTPFQESKSATVVFEKGQHKVMPEVVGISLNGEKLMEDMQGRIRTFSTVPITATIKHEQPEVNQDELQKILPELKKIYNTSLSLASSDFNFPVRFRDHLNWMEYRKILDTETGGVVIKPKIQKEVFLAYAQEEWVKKVNREPAVVTISKDEKGKVVFDGKGKNGLLLNTEKLFEQFVEVLEGGVTTTKINLPVEEKAFVLHVSPDLQALGIKEVVSIGHTSYYGSPQNRMFNINVGINKFNGLVIPQGEIFSFNTHLGPVDGQHGFLKELVIKPEGTIPEFGGGLCQVSTTVYRGALYAGLPIVERSPHSYAVSYYSQIGGHGIDATIYPGAKDFRFKNDTPGALLLQAYTEGAEAYFIFYGTKDGREVKLEGPIISNRNSIPGTNTVETDTLPPGTKKQVEKAHVGFSTVWYRYVTLPGGLTQKETVSSIYKATQDKILVGVAKPGTAPAPTTSEVKSFSD